MRLIDADKLRQDVLDFPNCYNGFSDAYDKARIIDAIDEQPTIEERKKGKWLPFEYGSECWHKCSACGNGNQFKHKVIRENGEVHSMDSVRNYCPNCGAKMEEEE